MTNEKSCSAVKHRFPLKADDKSMTVMGAKPSTSQSF